MTVKAAKEKLHDLIDYADEAKIFELLALFEESADKEYAYSEEALNMLRERSEQYLSGRAKTYSLEESLELIRAHRKGNGI